jgi:hypothetical protein
MGLIPLEFILRLKPHHPLISSIRKCNLWLNHFGVNPEAPKNNENHFRINELEVRLSKNPEQIQGVICLDLDKINSKDESLFLSEFHKLTQILNLGKPNLPKRAPPSIKKIKSSEDFQSVALRHSEFGRAPNPKPEHLLKYNKPIKISSSSFLRKNRSLCAKFGYGMNDLVSFAQVWTVSWMAHTELPSCLNRDEENPVLLMVNLKKRFLDLFALMKRREKLLEPDQQTVFIHMGGKTFDLNKVEDEEINYLEDLTPSQEDLRRKTASLKLESGLAQMPHEKLLLTLETYSKSLHAHPDAAKEALKRLKAHQSKCQECLGQENKDISRINSLG